MKRRDLISFLAGATACPLAASAQQATTPLIGYLNGGAPSPPFAAFHQGLASMGFVEGRNVAIEYRWAHGDYERLPAMAAELVRRQIAVLGAGGGVHTAIAAKAATTSIPIVFSSGSDPIKFGLVASLNRPGGNVTGVSFFTAELEGRRLGILRELVPHASVVAVLRNPTNANAANQLQDLNTAALTLGLTLHVLNAGSEREIDEAFANLAQLRAGALHVASDPFFFSRRQQIITLAARTRVPAIYEWPEYAKAGGLATYGTKLTEAYHLAGAYTGRILKGEKPADLPVVRSTRFELVLNLRTAKALALDVPPTLSARADEIIE